MIGAFAYGWPLMKDPVGGVQPIEYMLELHRAARSATRAGADAKLRRRRRATPAAAASRAGTCSTRCRCRAMLG